MNEIEKAIQAINDFNSHKIGQYELMEHLDTILSALEAQQADRWIPVSEKLPEKGQVVLVTDGKDYQPIHCVAVIKNGEWRVNWNHDRFGSIDIVAWKPITPYKEEQV